MSEIVPPTATPPPTLTTAPRIPVVLAPPSLVDLPLGAKLDVTVQQLLNNAQTRLTTPLGDITLATGKLSLKPGDNLLLQLVSGGARPTVKLSLPSGAPLPTQPGAAPGQSVQATPGQAATVVPSAGLRIGATVTGTLQQPLTLTPALTVISPGGAGSASSVLSGGGAPATPAAAISAGIPGAPTAIPAGGQTTGGSATTPSSAQASGQQPTTPTPGGPTVIQAGSSLTLKIVGIQVPETGTSPLPASTTAGGTVSLAPGTPLPGTVTGQQGVTHLLVQTPVGTVSIPTKEPFQVGTQLQFEIVRLTPTTVGAQSGSSLTSTHGLPVTDEAWPALDETLSTLRDAAPGAQTQVLQSSLPRADAQLTTNMLFFIAALRGGDVRGWLGDGPARILERIRPDLAGRLRDDLGQMTRVTDDPNTGDWRLFAMPFLNDGDLERVRLLLREDAPEDDDDPEGKGGSRFVIDLNLSRLGHLQLDGLVGNGGKRLDLVVRSDEPLEGRMRQDIRGLYAEALELTGIDGSVGFQSKPANFVTVRPQAPDVPNAGDGVVV